MPSSTAPGGPIPTLLHVDPHKPGQSQPGIHTRWHPLIPPITTIPLGRAVKIQCIDYSGGQVSNDDCANDILHLDHDMDHHLSGPFAIPNARPGDALEIQILDVQPFDSQPWGYSVTIPGLGSLDEPETSTRVTKTIWDFEGVQTSSRHVPHVAFHGRPHAGVMGTAPSHELLAAWNSREAALNSTRPEYSDLPKSHGAYVGQELPPDVRKRIYAEGARTSPAREHGGNMDIASLVRGSTVYLPVYVPGANLSVGDLHFCQADAEPTTAIEMSGIITLKVNLMPGGVDLLGLSAPIYRTSPSEPLYPRRLVFTGLSVLPDGAQTDGDGMTAYRNAAFTAMRYLQKLGFSREQAYVLLSVAPIETKVIASANRPNMTVSLGLPIDIFDFDILPAALGKDRREITGPAMINDAKETNGHSH